MRYTEVRLSPIAMEMLADIEKDTVDFGPNFDESLKEPLLLPSKIPNLLLNGSSGIAVGMATNIPPHNLNEVVDGLEALIDDPALESEDLMKWVKGPDFPTGGFICGDEGVKSAYTTGRGTLTLRARVEVEDLSGGKQALIVREIPYQVNKSLLVEKIAACVRDKKIVGISDLRDESDRNGMRIFIELKRDANKEVTLNQLFKHTDLQSTFGVNTVALTDGAPKLITLKDLLQEYIDHREIVVTRRSKFELARAEDEAHILEGLRICLEHLDAVIKLIRSSKTPDEARKGLISKFKLSQKQAQAILDMRLQRLTQLERHKIEEDYQKLKKRIAELKELLGSRKKLLALVRKELQEIKEKYGDPRRTNFLGKAEDIEIEELIPNVEVAVLITRDNYIKRMPATAFRTQHRGGVGVTGMTTREEDVIEKIFVATARSFILFFTNSGKVFRLKAYDIPEAGRTGKGQGIANLLQLTEKEFITGAVAVPKFDPKKFLVMGTEGGVVKKTPLPDFENIRRTGIMAITLKDKDQLRWVHETNGSQEIIFGTETGMVIRFKEKDVRPMGRAAGGVKGVRLRKGDTAVSMDIVSPDGELLAVSSGGYGKRMPFKEFRVQTRGGKGVTAMKTRKDDRVCRMALVFPEDDLLLVTAKGVISRQKAKGVSTQGRYAKGVRVQRLEKGDTLVDFARIGVEQKVG